ncbi:DoxX family membrane protein [Hanstruepera flava]|uniref:DoxX family membrane protein n=1 Tax=Hanstruepera flava TaxID=2930218 RepID=UPI00202992E5|nr:DoxX family membrane protein [Hanstruepera flava]
MKTLEAIVFKLHEKLIFKLFTWGTRILLSLAFIPSGLKKLLGQRFTLLGTDDPVGFFFEALYQTGWYWNFLGFMQLLVALLLLIPRTAFLGAVIYLPIVINIFVIVTAMGFQGTPIVAGLMLLANIYLLIWDYAKTEELIAIIFRKEKQIE